MAETKQTQKAADTKADKAQERVAQAPTPGSKAEAATTHVTQAPTTGEAVIDDARFDRKASPGPQLRD